MLRKFLLIFVAFTLSQYAFAQSSMTDEQIMEFVIKEQKAGSSQSQIVTKLMQRGVTVAQLRKVKEKYERASKDQGLGIVSGDVQVKTDDRSRKSNGDTKSPDISYRLKDNISREYSSYEENPDFMQMKRDVNDLMPDSLKEYYDEDFLQQGRKVFGRDIFNKKDLTFEPNMNIATPQDYRIGPGDVVFIDIYGASQKTIECTVSPDETIVVEGVGPIKVGGLTVAQANQQLKSQVGARYSSSNIQLTVGQTRTIMVNVMGEVKNPGTYTLSAFATVFHAMYMAGGTNEIGTLRDIKVYRNNRLVTTVDIYDYILNGKLMGNIRLQDNDVIVVGPYDCLVNITGKVKRPMFYEMKKTESVGTLLKYSGGFTGDAYTKSVRLVRKSGREFSIYNIGEFDMNAFQLADEDSLNVDSILPRYSNMVELKGAVFRPGMYQVGGDITSVRTLLEHAEGVTEEAFTTRAVMHRMRPDRTLEVIPVDVDGIISGNVADIPLQNNDVLFIPTKQEMMELQTITIHGKVRYPGIYKYAANETIEDFILQAGGLSEGASTMKVDVFRRINNPLAETVEKEMVKEYTFSLRDGFVIDGEPGFVLMPFDEVYVRENPAYSVQQKVTIVGSVNFAGDYVMTTHDYRLSDLVNSAGGFSTYAYSKGAKLVRKMSTEEIAQKEVALKNAQIQMYEEAMQSDKQYNMAHADSLLELRMELSNSYVVAIDLDKAMANQGGLDDLLLREGDIVYVPQFNNLVKVSGEVMSSVSLNYQKGKNLNYYIRNAGGYTEKAGKSKVYAVYMNGAVKKLGRSGKDIEPGCEIVVPSKQTKNKLTTAERMSIGTSTASIAAMIATLINALK